MRIPSFRIAALIAALLLLPGSSRADWLQSYTGQTSTAPGTTNPNDSTTVYYAVYNNSNGSFASYLTSPAGSGLQSALLASLGGSTAALNTLESDKYVYFYQVANPTSNIKEFFVANSGGINVSGYANGFVFSQGTNGNTPIAVTGANGKDSSATLSSTLGGIGSSTLTFTSSADAKSITDISSDTFRDTGANALEYDLNHPSGISPGQYSSLIVVGSMYGPTLGEVQTGDGGAAFAYNVPVPTPEPGTLALMALAVPLLGFGYVRQLRKRLRVGITPVV